MGHHNHFVFIGDERIKQIYKSFVSQFMVNIRTSFLDELRETTDLIFDDAQLKLHVEFLWRPKMDNHMLEDFKHWMMV